MGETFSKERGQAAEAGVPRHLWLLHALAGYMPAAAFFVVDHDFRYLLAGGSALADAGMTPADFEGRHVADVAPPELLDQYLADYTAIFDGKSFVREHFVGERLYSTYGKLIKGRPGSRDVALAISYEMTQANDDP